MFEDPSLTATDKRSLVESRSDGNDAHLPVKVEAEPDDQLPPFTVGMPTRGKPYFAKGRLLLGVSTALFLGSIIPTLVYLSGLALRQGAPAGGMIDPRIAVILLGISVLGFIVGCMYQLTGIFLDWKEKAPDKLYSYFVGIPSLAWFGLTCVISPGYWRDFFHDLGLLALLIAVLLLNTAGIFLLLRSQKVSQWTMSLIVFIIPSALFVVCAPAVLTISNLLKSLP